jgi:hypothetical protein
MTGLHALFEYQLRRTLKYHVRDGNARLWPGSPEKFMFCRA